MSDTPISARSTTISDWIGRFLPLAPADRPVLDLAAGSGRHARYALSLGLSVTVADRDLSGTEDLASEPRATRLEIDLEDGTMWPFTAGSFGALIVTNYLYRPALTRLPALLCDGGILMYETFAHGNAAFGRPSNPDYLLQPGELLDLCAGRLTVIAYEHGRIERRTGPATGPAMVQRIAAMNGAPGPTTRL